MECRCRVRAKPLIHFTCVSWHLLWDGPYVDKGHVWVLSFWKGLAGLGLLQLPPYSEQNPLLEGLGLKHRPSKAAEGPSLSAWELPI